MQQDEPSAKPEKVATVDEIRSAIDKLTAPEWAKLRSYARARARMMQVYGSSSTDEDLVSEAISRLLEEKRTWNPKKVDFVDVVFGAMRSIASNYVSSAKAIGYELPASQVLAPSEEEDDEPNSPIDVCADPGPSAERRVIACEQVSKVYDLFSDDPAALLVMDGLQENMKGTEIMDALELTRPAYETVVKRIRRNATRWAEGGRNGR